MFFKSIIRLQEQNKNFINKTCLKRNSPKHNKIKALKEHRLKR